MTGEHVIPFRRTEVVTMCADELPAGERDSFLGLAKMLASLVHHRFQARIEALKDAYRVLSPEAGTRTASQPNDDDRRAAQFRLEEELVGLANAANFTQIDPGELGRALTGHSLLKVRMAVDTNAIEKI